jgi:hypothetical protein
VGKVYKITHKPNKNAFEMRLDQDTHNNYTSKEMLIYDTKQEQGSIIEQLRCYEHKVLCRCNLRIHRNFEISSWGIFLDKIKETQCYFKKIMRFNIQC